MQRKRLGNLYAGYLPSSEINQPEQTFQLLTRHQKSWALKALLVFIAIALVGILTADVSLLTMISAMLVTAVTLLPSYLWCSNQAKGLPLFPLLALSYFFTHVLPLISNDPKIIKYSEIQHFDAALVTSIFLLIATAVWFKLVKNESQTLPQLKAFNPRQVQPFFLSLLAICIVYHIGADTGLIGSLFSPEITSAMKVGIPGLTSLGLIILGYERGKNNLTWTGRWLFIIFMMLLVYVSGASIYLNIPGIYILLASVGWMLSSGKIPWRLLLISFLIIAFLNVGKNETRNQYWHRDRPVQLVEYRGLYMNWIDNSLRNIKSPEDIFSPDQQGSISNRSGTLELLLKVMNETGTRYSYLNGETYRIIPQLLIPRFLNSSKIRGAEGNHILSVHYGLKTYEETFTTSIGWGLLQEAYANFGWIGCMGLGLFIGRLYGWVTQWSMNVPATSYRFLVATIFLALAIKTEITAGIFAGVVWNSLLPLLIIRKFSMQNFDLKLESKDYGQDIQKL